MGRILKFLLYSVGALVALLVIVAIGFSLLFDPNDYRDTVSATVQDATGRSFEIEGDLDVSLFPWLAIEIGRTRLGNAEGFGDEAFAEFERARLSVRVMPLIFQRQVSIGTAELESLTLNLTVREDGVSNWQDLAERGEAAESLPAEAEATPAGDPAAIDISSINLSDATLNYVNAQLGEEYRLSGLTIQTGTITAGEPVDLDGGFRFSAQPAGVTGEVSIESGIAFEPDDATIRFAGLDIRGSAEGVAEAPVTLEFEAPAISLNTEGRMADVGEVRIKILDVNLNADVEPFSYADSPAPQAKLSIDAFSPRSLMNQLGIEPPPTADPNAFELLRIDAVAAVSEEAISLGGLELAFDDTTLRGQLVVPRDSDGTFVLELAGDTINVTRYMAPADASAAESSESGAVPVEIPVDLIRALNARGSLTLQSATLSNMQFDNVELGVNSGAGKLRFHPITAEFFDGRYAGDTRIDATGDQAVMTVDERIENVSLGPLAQAVLEQDNITGTINGRFQLSGRGNDMAAVQRTLNGDLSFVLKDGAFEGTDVWYQLRKARATFKGEQPPEPELPARTRFSEVSATGKVTNGVMQNDDFKALLPFMRLEGRGSVNLVEASVDYSLTGRVLDTPELADAATAEELDDLTRVAIPLRITGPLAQPGIGVDFEALLKEQVEEKLEEEIKDRLKDIFQR